MIKKLSEIFLNITSLDSRSLSLFRILLGLTSIFRFGTALYWSDEFLAPAGFLPVVTLNYWATKWSLFFLNDTLTWAKILCTISLLFSLLLVLGFRTKTVLIVLWILTTSLTNRQHHIENNGFTVFRLALFWSIFVPLDRHFIFNFSKTSKLNNFSIRNPMKISGLGPFVLFMQFVIIYFFAGVTKTDESWIGTHDAIYKALSLGAFAAPLGTYLNQYYSITQFLTISTIGVETILPLLLLIEAPWLRLRSIATFAFLLLPIIFGNIFDLGIFPIMMCTYATCLIPSWWWDRKKESTMEQIKQSSPTCIFITSLFLLALFDACSSSFKKYNFPQEPAWVNESMLLFRIDQKWWMFVLPAWYDFWIDVEGVTVSGNTIDPWSWFVGREDTSFSTDRPEDIRNTFYYQPWNNYIHQFKVNKTLVQWYLYSLCQKYNLAYPNDKITNLKLHYSSRHIVGHEKIGPTIKEIIGEWECK